MRRSSQTPTLVDDVLMDPTRQTACGLSLLVVQRLMVERVTIWADRKHADRVLRDRQTEARAAAHRSRRRTIDGQRQPWVTARRLRS